MKKTLSMILALVLCLSLCACGGDGDTETKQQANSTETTVEDTAAAEVVLHLNETTTVGDYELTITDVRVVEKFVVYSELGSRSFGAANSDSYQVVVLYTMKNIGKEEISAVENSLYLEYSDGYKFDAHLYYHNTFDPDILSAGGTQESYVELEVLGGEKYFLEAFSIPVEAAENTDEPLMIRLNANCFGVEEANVVYNIRPVDDTQKEALYQQAVSLAEEKNYKLAMDKLDEIGEYKDSTDIYDECMRNWAVRAGTYYNETEAYIAEHLEEFETLTGEELSSMMAGTWQLSKGSNAWQFNDDGTIDDGWGNERSWSVSGDNLILKTDDISDTLTVKRICENGYILCDENGAFYSTMYIPD